MYSISIDIVKADGDTVPFFRAVEPVDSVRIKEILKGVAIYAQTSPDAGGI
jgi:hypothetical protein